MFKPFFFFSMFVHVLMNSVYFALKFFNFIDFVNYWCLKKNYGTFYTAIKYNVLSKKDLFMGC